MSAKRLVIVVEDDADIARLIQRTLESFDFEVRALSRGGDLMKLVNELRPTACVIDLGLPDVDGLQLIKQLGGYSVAVLAVTGRGDLADRIVGLEVGADDYIVKPFEPRELVARLNSVLRRMSKAADRHEAANFSGWQFDPYALRLTSPGREEVRLSRAEAQLLELFLRAPNRVLIRDHLLDACGTTEEAFDRSIDVRVSRLRQKLGDNPAKPQFIRTIYGCGYLFASPVEWTLAA
jgi:two-component system OmpR family response regulator